MPANANRVSFSAENSETVDRLLPYSGQVCPLKLLKPSLQEPSVFPSLIPGQDGIGKVSCFHNFIPGQI